MKITTNKQLYTFLSIIALIIAGILGYIIKTNNSPYSFVLEKKKLRTSTNIAYTYNDFDNDGKSEKISLNSAFLKSEGKKIPNDNILIYNSNDIIVEQFNLFSYSFTNWLHFEDYNNDGYKELFAFSQLNDSLFLSVINLKTKKYILNRQFIFSKPDSAHKDFWDIWVQASGLLKVNENEPKNLIFQVIGAYSIYPRSVYSYNIEKRRIVNKFETGSLLHIVEFGDLDNDGNKDLILYTDASGNLDKKVGYHDYCNWLFVLNNKLEPIFTPKKIGSYPGSISVYMINSPNQKNLFVVSFEVKNSKRISVPLLYNFKGELIDTLKYLPQNLNWPFKTVHHGKDYIFVSTKDGKLLKLNNQLKIIGEKYFDNTNLSIIAEIEYGIKRLKGLLAMDRTNTIYLFDKNLNTLATYKLNEAFTPFKGYYSTRYRGANKCLQLALVGSKNNYLFTIQESKIYEYLPLIIFAAFLLSFILVGGLHILYSYFSTYLNYFRYTLNRSSNAVVILDSRGRICKENNNIRNYFNLVTPIKKKESFRKVFQAQPEIVNEIAFSIKTKKQVKKDIHISSSDYQFEGNITVTPFSSFIGFTHSYLIEISDFTKQLLTDRNRIWAATLQRIAHEIKTPLSTLILSLENVRTRLVDKDVHINEEINMMQEELERIKQLTKNFMMFTNLEETELVVIPITKIIKESLNNFRSYFEKEMALVFEENDTLVLADKRQLVQLFSLIIENAIDACEGAGTIKIKVERQKLKDKSKKTKEYEKGVSDSGKHEYVKIIISDNGKGMDNKILQKIFEPYFTTKKDGTGLGLSLVKKIIEDNKGEMDINSQLGVGTTITIYLLAANLQN